jgi:putative flippase GtrA
MASGARLFDRLPGFAAVGLLGFAVDGGVLSILVQINGWNPFVSRGASFALAVTVTWLLNRFFVFHTQKDASRRTGSEYGRYLVVQIGGAIVNLGVYWGLLTMAPGLRATPIIALACGAVFGLVFNYVGARVWVFSDPSNRGTEVDS